MLNNVTDRSTFPQRMFQLLIPTFFVWLLTFDWIARAHPGIQAFTRIAFTIMALLWVIQRLRNHSTLLVTSSGLLLCLYVAYSGILIFRAPLKLHAIEVEVNSILYLLAFLFFLEDTQSETHRRAWQFAFLQVAIIFSIFNLLLVARWWNLWLQLADSPFQLPPFGFRLPGLFLQHPNVEAAFLNLVLPFIFLGIIRSSDRKLQFSLSLLLLLFMITSFFASSRGAWLATASSLGVVVLLYYWEPLSRSLKQFLQRRKLRISFGRILLIICGLIAIGSLGLLSYQQARYGSHGGRLDIWRIAWEIFLDAPLLGHGPGSFHVLSAVKAGIPPGFYLVHAHNLILQILGEAGVIGVLILGVILFQLLRCLRTRWPFNKQDEPELIAYIAVFIGMLTHQMVDYAFEAPLYSVGIMYILANISRLELKPTIRLSNRHYSTMILLGILILYGAGSIFTFRGASDQFQAVQAAQDGDWESARIYSCRAKDVNGSISFYAFQCGLTSAISANVNDNDHLLQEAQVNYQSGFEVDPYWSLHRASLASIEWELGSRQDALEHMLEAQSQSPRSSILALNLAWMYAEQNQTGPSSDNLQLAFELNPWLWRSYTGGMDSMDEILDPENLERIAEGMPKATYYALTGWLYLEADAIEKAGEAFTLALDHDPLRVEAYAGLGKIALLAGDRSEAERFLLYADLTGRRSSILEEVKGEFQALEGNTEVALEHWLQGARLILWPSDAGPYYESAYGRAYLPMDYPPQVILPSLSPTLKQGFLQALEDSRGSVKAEAETLLPWFLSQIDVRSNLDQTKP
jgi:O-antigen ligase/tetratricopeptide (TPR) repeat protein